MVELDVQADGEQHRCSALIEIWGRAQEGKAEFFVQELISDEAGSLGEAYAARLVEKGFASAVLTDDYDALLFGSPETVR